MNKLIIIILIVLILVIILIYPIEDTIYLTYLNITKFDNKVIDINNTNFKDKKKICILSTDDRDLEYLSLHKESFQKYCNIHNYTFIFEKSCTDLPVFFCKFSRILSLMEETDYDYYIWVDSDAIINKKYNSFPLESLIEQIGTDTDVITSYFTIYKIPLFKPLVGGFYVFKKNNKIKKLLKDCIDYIDFSKWKNNFKRAKNAKYAGYYYEEAALFYSIQKNNVVHKRIKGKFISNDFFCADDHFITHLLGKKDINNCFKKLK